MKTAVIIVCCFAVAFGSTVGEKKPLTPEDLSSDVFRYALECANLEMNKASNHPLYHAMRTFLQGTQQLWTANDKRTTVIYDFSSIFGATDCENHLNKWFWNIAKCFPNNLPGASEFHCTFKVLYQPWASITYRIHDDFPPSCVPLVESPVPAAGQKVPLTPEEVHSPMFQGAMTTSAVHFNQNSGFAKLHSLVRYDQATKQVVTGILFEFETLFAETACENTPENHGKGIEECALGNSTRTFACHYKVLFKAWTSPQYTVLDEVSCKPRI